MLEDVLLIEDKHKDAAENIVNAIDLSDPDQRLVIAIGGESGSGKSELAHMVAKILKGQQQYTKIIHTDDFYRIAPHQRTEWRQSHDMTDIGLDEYDWEKIEGVIEDFKNGEISTMPCVDLLTDQIDTLSTNFGNVSHLILEGLYSLNAPADEKVFIQLTYHETKKAQLLRGKEPQNDFRRRVLEREHEVIQAFEKDATVIISKDFEVHRIKKKT